MTEKLELADIDELRETIRVLNNKLELLEDSKKTICSIILKEKESF